MHFQCDNLVVTWLQLHSDQFVLVTLVDSYFLHRDLVRQLERFDSMPVLNLCLLYTVARHCLSLHRCQIDRWSASLRLLLETKMHDTFHTMAHQNLAHNIHCTHNMWTMTENLENKINKWNIFTNCICWNVISYLPRMRNVHKIRRNRHRLCHCLNHFDFFSRFEGILPWLFATLVLCILCKILCDFVLFCSNKLLLSIKTFRLDISKQQLETSNE